MPFFSKPFRHVAATAALTCFSVGLLSAHGAHAVERHRAVQEARTAAAAFEDNRTQFEDAIDKAEQAVQQAQGIDEDEAVDETLADAAQALTASVESAERAAADAEAAVETVPVVTDEVLAAADEVVSDQELEAVTDGAGTTASDLDSAQDAVIAVEDVLEGEIADADAARAAAERLTEASEALDSAAADVEHDTATLERAAQEIELAQNLVALDAGVEQAQSMVAQTTELLSAVGQHVATGSTVTTARAAESTLRAATERAEGTARTDAAAVAAELDALTETTTALDVAMAQVQDSYAAWRADEASRRDAVNAERLDAYDATVAQARKEWRAQNRAAVADHQAGWTGQPTGVTGSNGRLAKGSLCELDFADGHYLQCDAAEALEAADDAYHAATGSHLSLTDSYRSYALQVTTKARKPSTAARPGTSNHGWGMAVDLDYASARWLAANGADYGWVHPTWARSGGARPEWWHLEYVATSVGSFVAPEGPKLVDPVEDVFEGLEFGVSEPQTADQASEDA